MYNSYQRINSTVFLFNSLIGKKLDLLNCLSLIHTFMESLPHAVLQAGAIVVKTVVNNNQQCFYPKEAFEKWTDDAYINRLSGKYAVNDQYQPSVSL